MSGLPTSPEHHPFRLTLEGAAQTTLTRSSAMAEKLLSITAITRRPGSAFRSHA